MLQKHLAEKILIGEWHQKTVFAFSRTILKIQVQSRNYTSISESDLEKTTEKQITITYTVVLLLKRY